MLVFLDNGHGGLIKNVPQTEERRSTEFSNKRQLFEGEFNRAIVNGIIQELSFQRIPYYHVCPELRDMKPDTRVNRANRNNEANAFFLSVHANASEERTGHGSEFFCHPNSRLGPQIATIFAEEFQKAFPDKRLRLGEGGKKYKTANFLVLRKTKMPCLLYTSPSPRDRTRSRMPSSA